MAKNISSTQQINQLSSKDSLIKQRLLYLSQNKYIEKLNKILSQKEDSEFFSVQYWVSFHIGYDNNSDDPQPRTAAYREFPQQGTIWISYQPQRAFIPDEFPRKCH